MLRSLFSGVSGLKNEQSEMDVIADNIANANTTGFKSSRITFSDSLSETISGASGTSGNFGGANPIQIGRGSKISSVDINFKQGSLNATGISTDLALNGSGFFVVTDGSQRYYSRAGAFQIQEDGTMMAQGGLNNVMGRLADADGNMTSTTAIEEIKLPFGKKDPAKATDEITMYCNLNRNASQIEEFITGDALLKDGEPALGTNRLDQLDASEIHLGDEIIIQGTDADGEDISATTFTYGDDGLTVNDLLAKINEAFSSDDVANGATATIDENGKLRLKANQAGKADFTIDLFAGSENNEATTETHTSGQYTVGGTTPPTPASTSSKLLSLDGVSGYSVGDTFTISGTNPDGSDVSANFVIEDGEETLQDVLDTINNTFTGINAELSSGRIVVTDNTPGYSETSLSITDGAGSGIATTFSNESFTSSTSWTDSSVTPAVPISTTTTLNNITGVNYTNGDLINISGTTSGGDTISAVYTVDNTQTVQDFLDSINNTFSSAGITASLSSNGEIVFTDSDAADTNNYTSIRIYDDSDNVGTGGLASAFETSNAGTNKTSLNLPAFSPQTEGTTGVHQTSITVYDSMGTEHVIDFEFTQNPDLDVNEWNWSVSIDNGSLGEDNIIGGTTGSVAFKEDGSLKKFSFDGEYDHLIFDSPGANRMEVDINAGSVGQFDGMTQLSSPSTTLVREQNGHSLGVLNDININNQGIVTGIYSNGVSKSLAQIAMANFTNESGLQKEGTGLFSANEASGDPLIGWAGTNNKTQIKSGNLESSNVDLTEEFSKMIIAQRSIEANSKVISTSDRILTTIITQMKRG